MNNLPWILATLLVLLPTAAAEPVLTAQSASVIQATPDLLVSESLVWEVKTNGSYDRAAHFWAPASATDLKVEFAQTGPRQPVPADHVVRDGSADAAFAAYRVDLSGVLPNATTGATYSVSVTYRVSGSSVQLRTWANPSTLAVSATAQAGSQATTSKLDPFASFGDNAYSTTRASPGANFTFDVSFTPLPATSVRDTGRYVWAAGGILIGFLFTFWAARRGWLGGAKATKFSKGGDLDSRALLEARRRTLLAALKELELAHENKEVPDDAYGPLKEEYKAQAVRVMRTLEEKKEGS